MGAMEFEQLGWGKDAREAFRAAVERAEYDHGHGGYTGTLAEKDHFVEIEVPDGLDPIAFAEQLIRDGDPRIDNKWGAAGCVKIRDGEYLFFGWASS